MPDAIVLDLRMPEFDGFKVVTSLRADPRTAGIPVIVHTGTVLAEDDHLRLASVRAVTIKADVNALLRQLEDITRPMEVLEEAS